MRPALALLYAVAIACLIAVVLAFAGTGLTPRVAWLSLALGSAAGAASLWFRRGKGGAPRERLGPWEWASLLLFTLFSLRAFLWVVFFVGDEVRVLSPNNLGDLSLHLTYINQLANGVRFWPENPIIAGHSLTYPIGTDLLHALLVLAGADLWRTFVWMGLIGALVTAVMLWKWGRAFAMAGLLCNGGLFGFAVLHDPLLVLLHRGFPSAILQALQFEDYQGPHGWKSIPLALFVTQRGLLFAFPAGLALLTSWRARLLARTRAPIPFAGELLLYAAMPLFHIHTFIALSLLLLVWFLAEAHTRRPIAELVFGAFVPATLLVYIILDGFRAPSMLGWLPGWMQADPDFITWCHDHFGTASAWVRVPAFWLLNFGALPFFVGLLVWSLWRSRKAEPGALPTVWYAIGLFVLCCFVKFAKWEWDNTKLMVWSYLLLLPYLWRHVVAPQSFPGRAVACVLLFGSGFASLLGGLQGTGFPIASRTELGTLGPALKAQTSAGVLPPETRFIAHPTYNHPLLLLGHPLALGYIGHVDSHGYDYHAGLKQVESVLQGKAGWEAAAQSLGCRYLFWGRMEEEAYPDSQQPWRGTRAVIFSGPWGTLYDLGTAAQAGL